MKGLLQSVLGFISLTGGPSRLIIWFKRLSFLVSKMEVPPLRVGVGFQRDVGFESAARDIVCT